MIKFFHRYLLPYKYRYNRYLEDLIVIQKQKNSLIYDNEGNRKPTYFVDEYCLETVNHRAEYWRI